MVLLRDIPENLQAQIPPKILGSLIKYRIKIKDHNIWDLSTWKKLLAECRRCVYVNIPYTEELFRLSIEDLLHCFPTSTKHWRELIDFEIKHGKIEKAKELFRRALSLPLLYVPIWQDYICFIRDIHQVKNSDCTIELKKAFEFALEKIGQDLNSGPLWIEYLSMISSAWTSSNDKKEILGENNFIEYVRSNFSRCLSLPHSRLDEALKLFEHFETEVCNLGSCVGAISSVNLAVKNEKTKDDYKSRRHIYALVNLELMATPPHQNTEETQIQNDLWQNVIEYERSNPQHLSLSELAKRIHFTFEQALIPFYRYPSFWLIYAQNISLSVSGLSSIRGVLQILGRAKIACPFNSALSFMQIQLLEQVGDKASAKDVYESLCSEMESEDGNYGDEQGSLIWIHYMHFLRRLEEPIKSRELFLRAKNWKGCTWQVYVASASLEWRSNEMGEATLKIVKKIFEKGFEKFYSVPGYINAYSSWLIGIGDENGARHLFEKVLNKPDVRSYNRTLWELYLDFESSRGDLGANQAVEKRMIDALSQSDLDIDIGMLRTKIFLRRSRLFGIQPYHKLEIKDISKYTR